MKTKISAANEFLNLVNIYASFPLVSVKNYTVECTSYRKIQYESVSIPYWNQSIVPQIRMKIKNFDDLNFVSFLNTL